MRKFWAGLLVIGIVAFVAGCQQTGEIPEELKVLNRSPALEASNVSSGQTLSITFNFPIYNQGITKENLFADYLGYGPSHNAGEPTVTSISWSADYKTLRVDISGWSGVVASAAKAANSGACVHIVPRTEKIKDIFDNIISVTLWKFYLGQAPAPTTTTSSTSTTSTSTSSTSITTTTSTTTTTILAGENWTEVTPVTGFSSKAAHSCVVFDNRMWVIGGWVKGGAAGRTNEVLSSLDGSTWVLETAEAAFPPIQDHTSVVFNNRMWIIGGSVAGIGRTNEVWSSDNGKVWTSEGLANFSPRDEHSSVVYNNKIWVIAGDTGSETNEVWSSGNGQTWNQETAAAAFPARFGPGSVVFNDGSGEKMWVIGGIYDPGGFPTGYNDVWYSSDGVTWQQATAGAGFPGRGFYQGVVHQGKMWVMGGGVPGPALPISVNNDVWYSSDGISWTEAATHAAWAARAKQSSVVFDDKIWVIGGYYEDIGLTAHFYGDIWYSPPSP